MHINGLRVLHHLREVRVDDLLEELILGGAWCCHGDLDLSQKQPETRTQEKLTIRWSKKLRVYIMIFQVRIRAREENGVPKAHEGPTSHQGAAGDGHAVLACASLVGPPDSFLFLEFF